MSDHGGFLRDLRFAARTLGRSPGFLAASLAILSLGIGIQTAAFSLLDAVVLRPLPAVRRPEELLDLRAQGLSHPTFADVRRETAGVFSGLAAWGNRSFDLVTPAGARRLRGAVVAGDYFGVLGVVPQRGRLLAAADEESGEPIAVVSDRLWRNELGSSPSAVGSAVRVNGVPFTVVGVAPAGFRGVAFGQRADLWIPVGSFRLAATGPLARLDYHKRGWGWLSAFGRLGPGVSRSAAQASVDAAARRQLRDHADALSEDFRIPLEALVATSGGSAESAQPGRLFGLLCAAVGIVLLVTCANLANLLLTRGLARRRELGVRLAIGASRGRIGRQLLTESLVLAGLGGLGGLVVASWALTLANGVSLPGGATLADFGPSLDRRALAIALAAAAATGILFGILPALQASRTDLLSALKGRPARAPRRLRVDSVLVAAQLALGFLLLAAAGLFVRSLGHAFATDLGFRPDPVASVSVQLGLARYDEPRALAFSEALPARVAGLPGVRAAAWAGLLPLSGDYSVETIAIDRAPQEQIAVDLAYVGSGYFRTIGLPILQGREFDDRSEGPAPEPRSVIVNEAAAKRFWPGERALGRRVRAGEKEAVVVGVAADSRFRSRTEAHRPQVYVPMRQLGENALLSEMTLLVRTEGDPASLRAPIDAEIARLDPTLPVFGAPTLRETVDGDLLPQRVGAVLLAILAALALALASIGTYGVVAAAAARRSRELALKLALGAAPRDLRWSILRESALTIAAGLGAGVLLALLAAPAAGRFLIGIAPADAPTFAAAVLALGGSALAASYLPARRALTADPMHILRSE